MAVKAKRILVVHPDREVRERLEALLSNCVVTTRDDLDNFPELLLDHPDGLIIARTVKKSSDGLVAASLLQGDDVPSRYQGLVIGVGELNEDRDEFRDFGIQSTLSHVRAAQMVRQALNV